MGLIVAPDTEVMCGYAHDSGTGGHPNGKCPFPKNTGKHPEPPYQGQPLGEVMRQQFAACAGPVNPSTGTLKRNGHCGSGYNEIIVSWKYWELNLPWLVEAVVHAGDKVKPKACKIHKDFLQYYNLTATQVPLLRYECAVQPFTPCPKPAGKCFVESSC